MCTCLHMLNHLKDQIGLAKDGITHICIFCNPLHNVSMRNLKLIILKDIRPINSLPGHYARDYGEFDYKTKHIFLKKNKSILWILMAKQKTSTL